jgi:hypothetical protein
MNPSKHDSEAKKPLCIFRFAVKKVLCTLEESAALAAATSDTFEDLPKSLAAEKMMFLEAR